MNTTKQEKTIKELFLGKCWAYLDDNFHKFSEQNKIKVVLALCTKNVAQEVEGMNHQQIVMMGEIKRGGEPLRFNFNEASSDLQNNKSEK